MGSRSGDPAPGDNDAASNASTAEGEFGGMVGRAPRMRALFDDIRRIAPLNVGVLVQGESGTGKELVARALHQWSHRSGRFVAVNCGAVAPELLSSQLFGHERGAFTGAAQRHAGYFEQAQGGTLFLDEITEMPPALQVYLLRVTETHTLTRVGGSCEMPVDVRVIAASNRDVRHAVAAGDMRSDLFFRLLEFPLVIPPLRERREDIELLARHFIEQLNARHGTCKHFSEQALHHLGLRSWPGNVRELRHVVKRQFIMSGQAEAVEIGLEPEQPLYRRSSDRLGRDGDGLESPRHAADRETIRFSVGMTLEDVECRVLLETLAHCHYDKRLAARVLGISLKTVYNKLERYRSRGLIDDDVAGDSE